MAAIQLEASKIATILSTAPSEESSAQRSKAYICIVTFSYSSRFHP